MEFPYELGEFSYLEVLDLEKTEIVNLPTALEKIANLRCLKSNNKALGNQEFSKLITL